MYGWMTIGARLGTANQAATEAAEETLRKREEWLKQAQHRSAELVAPQSSRSMTVVTNSAEPILSVV